MAELSGGKEFKGEPSNRKPRGVLSAEATATIRTGPFSVASPYGSPRQEPLTVRSFAGEASAINTPAPPNVAGSETTKEVAHKSGEASAMNHVGVSSLDTSTAAPRKRGKRHRRRKKRKRTHEDKATSTSARLLLGTTSVPEPQAARTEQPQTVAEKAQPEVAATVLTPKPSILTSRSPLGALPKTLPTPGDKIPAKADALASDSEEYLPSAIEPLSQETAQKSTPLLTPAEPLPKKFEEKPDRGKEQAKKPAEHHRGKRPWCHRFYKRTFIMNIALGVTIVVSVTATVLSLMWMQWDVVEVSVQNYGTVRGFSFTTEGKKMHAFLGIYYAKTTEGTNRFKRPIRYGKATRVVDATLKRPGCTQQSIYLNILSTIDNQDTIEDCLHLNIWTPCLVASEESCRKTVVVFLFGTRFQNGDNNRYDGRYFAALGDVILVVPNFRLGAFAFVADKGVPDAPGNIALHDQELAVEWVLSHIEYFGGNSSDIVLMGSGSGAWSLGAHFLSANPLWRRRFSRIILQGEGPFGRQFVGSTKDLGAALNCPTRLSAELLQCLRQAPAQDILRNTRNLRNCFGPSTDVDLLTDPPTILAKNYAIQDKEILVGCVANEGSAAVEAITFLNKNSTSAYLRSALDNLFYVLGIQNRNSLFDLYTNGSETDIAWAHRMVSDILHVCPLISFANHLTSRGNRVYGYYFDYKGSFSPFQDSPGAPQLHDLDFIFGVPLQNKSISTESERALSRMMIQIWTAFAKTGKLPLVDNSPWPAYTTTTHRHVSIALRNLDIISHFHRRQCTGLAQFMKELQYNSTY